MTRLARVAARTASVGLAGDARATAVAAEIEAANDSVVPVGALPLTGSQYDEERWKRSSALAARDTDRDDMPAPRGYPSTWGRRL